MFALKYTSIRQWSHVFRNEVGAGVGGLGDCFLLLLPPPVTFRNSFLGVQSLAYKNLNVIQFFYLQDQFALALSQAVGSTASKKEDELVGSKLNKVREC